LLLLTFCELAMKRQSYFFAAFWAVFIAWSVLSLGAAVGLQSPTVLVTVSDFTLEYTPDSRTVTLSPHSGAAVKTGTSDSDGNVAFVNVTPGLWTLRIAGVGLPDYTLQVPNSSGTLNATNLIISAWTPPAAVPYVNTNSLELSKRLSIVDDVLNLDGSPITGGGDTVFTNMAGVIYPSNRTEDRVSIGTGNGSSERFYSESPAVGSFAMAIRGYLINSTNAGGAGALYYNDGNFSVVGEVGLNGSQSGESVAIFGYNPSGASLGYGVAGGSRASLTNVAVAGSAKNDGTVTVGGYFETATSQYGTNPNYQNAVLLLDNRDSALPLIIARNNGTTKFSVSTNGQMSLAGTTNQVTFGATNTAPSVTTNAAKWISVQVSGFTNAYRIPLYE